MWRAKVPFIRTLAVLVTCVCAARAEQVDPSLVGVWSSLPPGVVASNLYVFELAPDGHYRMLSPGSPAPSVTQGEMAAIGGRWSTRDASGRMDWGTYQFLDANTVAFTGTGGTATWYRTPIVAPEPPPIVETDVVVPECAQVWFDQGICNFCIGRFEDAAFFFCRASRCGHCRATRQFAWHCQNGVGMAADPATARALSQDATGHAPQASSASFEPTQCFQTRSPQVQPTQTLVPHATSSTSSGGGGASHQTPPPSTKGGHHHGGHGR